MHYDLAILFEHSDWHQPLFDELDLLNINYCKIDLSEGAMSYSNVPDADVYYNMVSPSAYKRDKQRAIPFSIALCRTLEFKGKKVLNGSISNQLEFSKSSQIGLLASINAFYPQTIFFNSINAVKNHKNLRFPMILKPEQGGSGSRMFLVNSIDELVNLLKLQPDLWFPDNLLLLQEKIEYDHNFGIVRIEFIEGKMLYAMRVVTNGTFNLCPSVVCNPDDNSVSACEIQPQNEKPVFHAYNEIPETELNQAARVFMASGNNTGSVEYMIDTKGRQVFYDINANSNLRRSIGEQFGINPFKEVAKYLQMESDKNALLNKTEYNMINEYEI